MKITLFTMAFNEHLLLQFMIDHYRTRFPNIHFVVFDNESTDDTKEIALKNGCEVRNYSTGGTIDDFKLRDLKNSCWRMADTDWVLVCDVDELLDINEKELELEEQNGSTIIKSEGYNMINMKNDFDLDGIVDGERFDAYDKAYLFNKKFITSINYECGAHRCRPEGLVKMSEKAYLAYHYKFINPDYTVDRFKLTAQRLSEVNRRNGMGAYNLMPEEEIRAEFERRKKDTRKIR